MRPLVRVASSAALLSLTSKLIPESGVYRDSPASLPSLAHERPCKRPVPSQVALHLPEDPFQGVEQGLDVYVETLTRLTKRKRRGRRMITKMPLPTSSSLSSITSATTIATK